MMPNIEYHRTSQIWLSLSDFSNKGLTRDEMKEVIEKLPDLGSNTLTLSARPSGLNSNLIVDTQSVNPDTIADIVTNIRFALIKKLGEKSKRKLP